MHEEDRSISKQLSMIEGTMYEVGAELIQEWEREELTLPKLIKFVQHQMCELAKFYHQLIHLQSKQEGEN